MPRYIKKANPNICSRCKTPASVLHNGWCNPCCNKAAAKRRKAHPEKYAAYRIKNKYSITFEEKSLMLMAQEYLCAACKSRFTKKNPEHIDHCHKSGKIRGILCADCNISLGRMKENPERLRKLADYIEQFKTS